MSSWSRLMTRHVITMRAATRAAMGAAMGTEVWILGGTARRGRADAARQTPDGLRTLVAGSMEDLATQIRAQQPAVVINTIGPFSTTAPPIVQACLQASSDYLDLANDVAAVSAVLALNEAATAAGRTIVTGAG